MDENSRKEILCTFVGREASVRYRPQADPNRDQLHVLYGMADEECCELGRLRCWDARTPGVIGVCSMWVRIVRDGTRSVKGRGVGRSVAGGGGTCSCCGTETRGEY